MKIRFKFIFPIFIFAAFLAVSSCSDKDPDAPKTADRTILVYMAANNSLGVGYDSQDIEEMEIAAKNGALGKNNRLMIYHAPTDGTQTLYEMDNSGNLVPVKIYDTDLTSVSADRMYEVFCDTKSYARANDYGLILWSHALGWTQNGMDDNGPTLTPKSWGNDRGKTMNITTLRNVLAASPWSWIYFDCCFMGSVEVLYELAPVVKSVVASATEVPLDGMPYNRNLPLLFEAVPNLKAAAQNTFDYYDQQFGMSRTCTIAVYELSGMETLASATVPIYKESDIVGVRDFTNLPLETTSSPNYYDLGVYVDGLCEVNGISDSLKKSWHEALDKVVIFSRATPKLWDIISLKDCTGISTFIPVNELQQNYKNYDTLAWYKEVAKWLYNKD